MIRIGYRVCLRLVVDHEVRVKLELGFEVI